MPYIYTIIYFAYDKLLPENISCIHSFRHNNVPEQLCI